MNDGALGWQEGRQSGAAIVSPRGRVDESTATEFGERLAAGIDAAAAEGSRRLVIDLAGIDYMSSRGLRALTLAQRRAKDSGMDVVLAAPNPVMREILAISRYDLVFKVFDRAEDAVTG